MCGAGTAGGPVLEQLESQCLLYEYAGAWERKETVYVHIYIYEII